MPNETLSLPTVLIRGRSFLALIVAPELPLEDWFAALDQQMQRSSGFFGGRPVIVNFSAALGGEEGPEAILDALDERELRLVGVEGIDPALLAGTRWERMPMLGPGREVRAESWGERPAPEHAHAAPAPVAAPLPASLLVDRPVRSGQSIIFEDGDITVIGSVASGAELIAGGSIHVYGALRGRAIAGLKVGAAARIFCSKLAAELVSIDGLYGTPEHWGENLQGRAVQILRDQGALRLLPLD